MAVSKWRWMQHRNEVIFPDPLIYGLAETGKGSGGPDDHLIAFGRGSRVCLGMALAWCELYITLGTMTRRFDES
jgi:cytochrome P450